MEKKKKRGLVSVIAAVVTVTLAFILFSPSSANEKFEAANASYIIQTEQGDFILGDEDKKAVAKSQSGISRTAKWLIRTLKSLLVGVVLAAASLLIKALGSLIGAAVGTGAGGVVGFLLAEFLPVLFMVVLVFCFLFKLLFPDYDLKSFLTFKNIVIMAAGSFFISLCSRASLTHIENRILASEINLVVSVTFIVLMWYLCFCGTLKSAQGPVSLLKTKGAAVMLLCLITLTAAVGLIQIALVNAGIPQQTIGTYFDCAWFCFVLVSLVAFISRHSKKKFIEINKN